MAKCQGRSSAYVVAVICLVILVLQLNKVEAATYTVGDSGGWTFNVQSWPKGKRFRVGDVLKFNYNPAYHNVVVVDSGGYGKCTTPVGAKVYKSGKDQITLGKGQSYFICNFAGHCQSGMKIAVYAY